MTFLERLRSAPESPQAQFNTFLMTYRPTGATVYAFLEGKDDLTFYGLHIRHHLPDGFLVSFVKCGNKDAVLLRLQDFCGRFAPNPRALFFVDKDLDDILGRDIPTYEYLFITEGYSIENEACVGSLVERYCIESLGLDSETRPVKELTNHFKTSWDTFSAEAILIMAWVLAVRRAGLRPNLNNLENKEIFTFSETNLTACLRKNREDTISYLHKSTGGSSQLPSIDSKEIDRALSALTPLDSKKWLRGKQALWFMIQFLIGCERALVAAGQRVHARITLSASNAIEVLCPKLDSPIGLNEFMSRVSIALQRP